MKGFVGFVLLLCGASLLLSQSIPFPGPGRATTGAAGPNWVKKNDQGAYGTSNPLTLTLSTALTNPSIIVVTAARAFQTTLPTPTDTAGNTYVDCGAGATVFNTSNGVVQMWYALNTHTTASNVVSLVDTPNSSTRLIALEFTGGKTSAPVDAFHGNANVNTGVGGGQNMTSGAATTTVNGDLVIGIEGDTSLNPAKGAVGTNFTTATSFPLEYLYQPTAASIAATWADVTNSDPYGAIMCALKVPVVVTCKHALPLLRAGCS